MKSFLNAMLPILLATIWLTSCSPPVSVEPTRQAVQADGSDPRAQAVEPVTPKPDAEPPSTAETVKLTADTIPADYSARAKFLKENQGKWIEVTAYVYDMGIVDWRDGKGWRPKMTLVGLKNPEKAYATGNLNTSTFMQCALKDEHPWKKCNAGDVVTVRGTPNAGGFLESCSVIDSQGEPVPNYSTAEFIAAYDEDPETFKTKLANGRCVIVTGKIGTTEIDDEETFYLGDEQRKIVLGIAADQSPAFADVKPGMQVTVISNLLFFFGDDTTLAQLGDSQRIDLLK